jgi:membrane-associated protease RseP (regulator of RpoE activity)
LKAFRRIFKYIWPQWPRIIVVVCGAIIVSLLLSVSFMAIIPLLKVMMGEEGLHGWVDRKTCNWRYGVDLYVPEKADLTSKDSHDIMNCLLVNKIKKGGLAQAAGLKLNDKIIGAGDFLLKTPEGEIRFAILMQEMAGTSKD